MGRESMRSDQRSGRGGDLRLLGRSRGLRRLLLMERVELRHAVPQVLLGYDRVLALFTAVEYAS